MAERSYESIPWSLPELSHAYGPRVHLLADPLLIGRLARLCEASCVQPEFNYGIADLYRALGHAALNTLLPRAPVEVLTRMDAVTPGAAWRGEVIARDTPAVTVNIARAGTLPSHTLFELLNQTVAPEGVRQDHMVMERETDEAGRVVGVSVHGSKIGGGVDGAYVFFPDPMAATGGSLSRAVSIYKEQVEGTPARFVALHLIVTPEYLRRVTSDHPDLEIFALRLDRGMSPPEILETPLGSRWEEERGLNEIQYIVPGGGGFGELMNNAFV